MLMSTSQRSIGSLSGLRNNDLSRGFKYGENRGGSFRSSSCILPLERMIGRWPVSCAASASLRVNASNNNVHRPQPAEAVICIWDMLSECLKHNLAKCSCQKYRGSESTFVAEWASEELKIRHKLRLLQVEQRAMTSTHGHVKIIRTGGKRCSSTRHLVRYSALARPHFRSSGNCIAMRWAVLPRDTASRKRRQPVRRNTADEWRGSSWKGRILWAHHY